MDIFSVFTLIGGLAFFLYGMRIMSSGLEKMAGSKLEKTLHKMTDNPYKSLALGAGITIAIQSSSALTVMLVGLVNSGIMELGQTIGIIMGSNIGTTLTAWIFSLTGIESHNIFIQLLKPQSFSPIVAFAGILLIFIGKRGKQKDIGNIMVGFAVLMYGMQLMGNAVSPLAEIPEFTEILVLFANPLFGVLTGAIFTGIIQSSAASIGILQALSLTGSLTYNAAIPLIMGQNIGTCVTSLLSSIGTNKNAKRVAAVHVYFNLIGTILCLLIYWVANTFFNLTFADSTINPAGIALIHSIFNVFTTLCLLPFGKLLEKMSIITIRDKEDSLSVKKPLVFLDERLLKSPSFALPECRNATVEMAKLSRDTLLLAIEMIEQYDEKKAKTVIENEETIDMYEDQLGKYLVKLASRELTHENSHEISNLLLTIGDFERIGDHAVGVLNVAQEMHDKGVHFSVQGTNDLNVITTAVIDIVILSIDSFDKNNTIMAKQVEPLEQVIDGLKSEIKRRHIARLQHGYCTIELGFIFSDLLTNYQRVSDHCSNIAVSVIQSKDSTFDTHGSLNALKTSGNPIFVAAFNEYMNKYQLPQ